MGVRQWVMNWLEAGRTKNEPERQTDEYPYPFGWFGGRSTNQPTVKRTPANLRTLSESPIPRRAINVIKDGITKLNWSVAAIDEGDAEKYKEICKIIERSLLRPNSTDSFRLWVEQIVEDMLVASAGATELLTAGDKLRPLRMHPVDVFSIELYPNWDGKRDSYRYAQRDHNGGYVHLMDSELMYIRMNPRSSTPFGLSPLETVWETVNSFISAHKSAGKQAGNSFIRKILNLGKGKDGGGVDKNTVAAYRAYWQNEVEGRGMMPIIGSDSPSIIDLGATDDKALYIDWQRFLIEIIAISFGISPKKLGQTKDVNKSTADSEDDDTDSTIQAIAENIVEHINNEIIDSRFKMGGLIEFKFHYATSLKDLKTKADIDAIYLDRRVVTPDEVRDNLGKKALPNNHGEVLMLPSKSQVIDINKPMDQQSDVVPEDNPPLDPVVKARRFKGAKDSPKGTSTEEEEWIAAYLYLMSLIQSRGKNVSSISSLAYVWTPTTSDIQSLSESLTALRSNAWLSSYNRRRAEMGENKVYEVPDDVLSDIRSLAQERAGLITDTYNSDLKKKIKALEQKYVGRNTVDKQKLITGDMEDWLRNRAVYKSAEISDFEAGQAWNQGLFAHDKQHAPGTEYYVFPIATNHQDCAVIIAGSPYTIDELPADLPLHPNCPHRYYAITPS